VTRLRRRLAIAVWFFALIVLGQSAIASTCFTDGLSLSNDTASSVAAMQTPSIADGADTSDTPCWHAGSGGCHCTCMHASGLTVAGSALSADYGLARVPPAAPTTHYFVHLAAELRPPIV
jgi:hypothetical protein